MHVKHHTGPVAARPGVEIVDDRPSPRVVRALEDLALAVCAEALAALSYPLLVTDGGAEIAARINAACRRRDVRGRWVGDHIVPGPDVLTVSVQLGADGDGTLTICNPAASGDH